jgi:hypothetical protein
MTDKPPAKREPRRRHGAKAPRRWQRLSPMTVILFLFIFIGAMLVIYFVAL